MFDDIGRKIKSLATIVCWLGIISCVITGIILIVQGNYLILSGLLVAIIGSLLSWIFSFTLYGFGQLIENSDIIAEQIGKNNKKFKDNLKVNKYKTESQKLKKVKEELNMVDTPDDEFIDLACPNCKELLTYTKSVILEHKELTCPLCDYDFSTENLKQMLTKQV